MQRRLLRAAIRSLLDGCGHCTHAPLFMNCCGNEALQYSSSYYSVRLRTPWLTRPWHVAFPTSRLIGFVANRCRRHRRAV